MAFPHATTKTFRFLLLLLNCLMTFGSYFCFDMPSVVQAQLQGNATCAESNASTPCCPSCLQLHPDQYNLLYTVFSWTSAFVAVMAGYFIDKLGNKVGGFIFSSSALLGSAIFAMATMPPFLRTKFMFPLLMLGRLLLGSGTGSLRIVQDRVTAYWFRDRELAMAFGITVASSRLGSVLNFLVTDNLSLRFGLPAALWAGSALSGLGFVVAIAVGVMDKRGIQQMGQTLTLADESKKMRIGDVRQLGVCFWVLAAIIMFYYSGVLPFIADSSLFMHEKFNLTMRTSSYISGVIYDVSILATPLFGYVVDELGRRGILMISCGVLTVPAFCTLMYTSLHPVVSMVWLGIMYSVAAISMWSAIPLVADRAILGTAMGIVIMMQGVGMGCSNLVIGWLLRGNKKSIPLTRWRHVVIAVITNVAVSSALAVLLNLLDRCKGRILNIRHKIRDTPKDNPHCKDISAETDPLLHSDPTETDPLLHPDPTEADPLLHSQPIN